MGWGGAVVTALASHQRVARVRILMSTAYKGRVCCWSRYLSCDHEEVFLRVLRFFSLLTNRKLLYSNSTWTHSTEYRAEIMVLMREQTPWPE